MFETLRSSYREVGVQRALLRHSRAWKELGDLRLEAFERLNCEPQDAWNHFKERRSQLVSDVVKLVRRTSALRQVARDLGLTDADLVESYRILLRHSQRPFALPPYHTPTALMLLPAWLEAVGALHLAGRLLAEAEKLEEAIIAMDDTFPLSVLEPLMLSGDVAHKGLSVRRRQG